MPRCLEGATHLPLPHAGKGRGEGDQPPCPPRQATRAPCTQTPFSTGTPETRPNRIRSALWPGTSTPRSVSPAARAGPEVTVAIPRATQVVDHNFGAVLGKQQGVGAANAATGTGYDDDFVVETDIAHGLSPKFVYG